MISNQPIDINDLNTESKGSVDAGKCRVALVLQLGNAAQWIEQVTSIKSRDYLRLLHGVEQTIIG